MLGVMQDRRRARHFGLRNPWPRWLASTQSTSLCRYLIETYGTEKFLRLYDRPFEAIDFRALYDRPAEVLIDDWLKFVTDLPGDTAAARSVFQSMQGCR
jgi:hypothetical protein